MGSNKTRGRPPKNKKITNPQEISLTESNNGGGDGVYMANYEQSREQRIKENQQRMVKLGLLDLSRNLKPPKRKKPLQKTCAPAVPQQGSPRRSSRLKIMTPISYLEKGFRKKGDKYLENVKINIKEGSNRELYTEEHEKLLGDCKTSWTLLADGQRLHDQYEGKSCHQCRQKTLGQRTACSKCDTVQGQFCGNCLYTRYGENILEVNENQDWVCPVCRGICNCSCCRRANGWEPTGAIFRKVQNLGFKSVAHYLIQTRGPRGNGDETDGGLLADKEVEMSNVKLVTQLDDKKDENIPDDGKQQDTNLDQDYDYEHLDEDDNNDGDNDDEDDYDESEEN